MADNRADKYSKSTINEEQGAQIDDKPGILEEIINNKDIDNLVDYLKEVKTGNTEDVLQLTPTFMEQHLGGVDMFLELAVKLEPENPEHHFNRALFFENQKSYEEAQEEYENAIQLDNENDHYYSEYGNLLMSLNDLAGAEKQYLEALDINPENADTWTSLGILYKDQENSEKAEDALKKAINLEPNSTIPYLNLIRLYRDDGKIEDAKDIIRQYKSLQLENLSLNIMHL
jgi:tetratricopeptide (TPR) repeat protein